MEVTAVNTYFSDFYYVKYVLLGLAVGQEPIEFILP